MAASFTKYFNTKFSGGVSTPEALNIPTNLTAIWIDDFARLSVDDIPVDVQIEWYESVNGGEYYNLVTTDADITIYDSYTWQNQLMAFKCRAKQGEVYSDFTPEVSIYTPLCHKITVSTAPQTLTLTGYTQVTGTVSYNWGDASIDSFTGNGNKSHIYQTNGTYYINVNNANLMRYYHINPGQMQTGTEVGNWVLPPFTGLRSEYMVGDLSNWICPTALGSLTTEGTANVVVPNGDMSNFILPANFTSWYARNCNFTNFPRGHFKALNGVGGFRWEGNNCSSENIDSFLEYLDTYFDTETPGATATYNISGTGMGLPTGGVANANIVAIKNHYTAAGKVATITINV